MEENGSTRYNPKTNSRISYTIPSKTTSSLPKCKKMSISNACVGGDVCHSTENEISRNFSSSSIFTKLYLSSISGAQTERISSTHIQPESAQRIRTDQSISLNKYAQNTGLYTAQGLDVQDRSFSSLLSSEGSSLKGDS